MNSYELSGILSQIRDMACAAKEYHRQGKLCPALEHRCTAPELRRDNRSDIYSLGVFLSMLLPPGPLTASDIPLDAARVVQRILTRTLSRHPKGRYSCCEELLEELDCALMLLQKPPDSS